MTKQNTLNWPRWWWVGWYCTSFAHDARRPTVVRKFTNLQLFKVTTNVLDISKAHGQVTVHTQTLIHQRLPEKLSSACIRQKHLLNHSYTSAANELIFDTGLVLFHTCWDDVQDLNCSVIYPYFCTYVFLLGSRTWSFSSRIFFWANLTWMHSDALRSRLIVLEPCCVEM